MKKLQIVLLVLVIMLLAACGGSKEVTITIPTNLPFILGELSEEEKDKIKEELNNYGETNVTFEDEQYSFTMTKADHEQFVQDFEKFIEEAFVYYSEGEYSHFLEMEVKDNYEHIYVTTEQDALKENMTWSLPITTLGTNVLMYQLYTGVAADDLHVTVHIIDEETEEEFEAADFPDFFE